MHKVSNYQRNTGERCACGRGRQTQGCHLHFQSQLDTADAFSGLVHDLRRLGIDRLHASSRTSSSDQEISWYYLAMISNVPLSMTSHKPLHASAYQQAQEGEPFIPCQPSRGKREMDTATRILRLAARVILFRFVSNTPVKL